MKKLGKKYGFTLAEVLITLLIIGVIAVIILPPLLANINERVLTERINNIEYKFTQATTKMVAAGNMDQFINTLAFVQGLEKHYVIQKVCTANQLRGCWPYDYVTLTDGTQWDITKTISGKQMKMTKDDNNDYTGQTVGIVNGDGTTMIISYNTKCATFDPAKTYPYSGFTNATTGCVAIVFDANGSRKPNTVGKDVVLFHANGLGRACAFEIGGTCFKAPLLAGTYPPVNCKDTAGADYKYCEGSTYTNTDYWAGAVKACGGKDNMASESDLHNIARKLYTPDCNDMSDCNGTLDTGKAASMGFPSGAFVVWSKVAENNEQADIRNFYGNISYFSYDYRFDSYYAALCKEE